MDMDYEKMTDQELENEMITLENNFKECQEIIKEAYGSMEALSNEYKKIKDILDSRNG